MEIKNYASALNCTTYALIESGISEDDKKYFKEKMEVSKSLM